MVPKITWRPSKKLSPMMMTVAPPVVHPSLGLMALMQGAAPSAKDHGKERRRGEKSDYYLIVGIFNLHQNKTPRSPLTRGILIDESR